MLSAACIKVFVHSILLLIKFAVLCKNRNLKRKRLEANLIDIEKNDTIKIKNNYLENNKCERINNFTIIENNINKINNKSALLIEIKSFKNLKTKNIDTFTIIGSKRGTFIGNYHV